MSYRARGRAGGGSDGTFRGTFRDRVHGLLGGSWAPLGTLVALLGRFWALFGRSWHIFSTILVSDGLSDTVLVDFRLIFGTPGRSDP